MKTIGIITYQARHLKTEQIMLNLLPDYQMKVYALPYIQRPERATLFRHRPDQSAGADAKEICEKYHIPYYPVSDDREIDNSCDLYLITGAGILSPKTTEGKKILNCHPGIIPAVRGLDALKWAIWNQVPAGNTLHFIDANVDMGEILAVRETPVFRTDTLETFARRHYDREIELMTRFEDCLARPENPFRGIAERPAMRRMPIDKEKQLPEAFERYKETMCK